MTVGGGHPSVTIWKGPLNRLVVLLKLKSSQVGMMIELF